MVKSRSRWLAVLAVLGAAAVWLSYGSSVPPAAVPAAGARTARGRSSEIARIDLSRLETSRGEANVGQTDIFAFRSSADTDGGPREPSPSTTLPTPTPTDPGPPPPPPLNVKYIGSLENPQGLKVAVLLTDRREVLYGQVGDVLANRFRIVKIGLESVDIQEMGSERIRRVPLRGN